MTPSTITHEAQKSELEQLIHMHHQRREPHNNGNGLSHRVYRFVVEKITSEEFAPAMKISERKIAAMMGISHIPVREAMGKLEQQGWVRRVPGKGAFVMDCDGEQMKYSYQTREIIETGAARIVAQKITDDQLDELKKVVRLLETANETNNAEVFKKADCQFHRLIVHFTGNRRLEDFFESVILQAGPSYMMIFWNNAVRLFKNTGRTPDFIDPSCHTHIYESFKSHEVELAESLIRKHIQHNYAVVSKMSQIYKELEH